MQYVLLMKNAALICLKQEKNKKQMIDFKRILNHQSEMHSFLPFFDTL